jgi:hypothetical protein
MNLIDDKGRLFGTVNIIDALAVLLVLAVVAAGAAFVLQPSGQTPASTGTNGTGQDTTSATRYATLDLGTQPSYVAERITAGDINTTVGGNLTVTDVYRTPADGGVHVWTRVELDGHFVERDNESGFTFGESMLKPGSALDVDTEEYIVNGTVHEISRQNPSLPGGSADVVLRTTTSADKAAAIHEGDSFTVANGTVATIKSVEVYPTGDASKKRVVLGMTLGTLAADGQQRFLGRPVQIGQNVPFRTDAYQLTGQIAHRGDTTLPGERTTTTATIKLSSLSPEIADGITVGMVERIDDRVNAEIVDRRVEPATVVVTSQDGEIHEREHPRKKDVTLTVELDARRTDAGLYFHGQQIQEGNGVVLDLDSITTKGQVIDIQQDE